MAAIVLNGITWGHSRGITALYAISQRYSEMFPDVEIRWTKRTLQEFADFPIEKLTATYDLLVIDHPWVGCAAATNCVLPLDEYLSKEFLSDQDQNSVGGSHNSYFYNNHQWALAIDAATPAASYRKDLLELNQTSIPQTWEDLIALAKKGKVAAPAFPIDLLMNFYTFCIAFGNEPFKNEEEVIDIQTGLQVIETMKEFYSLLDKKMFESNPIAVAEMMSNTDQYWYCPFAYGYSNYSRKGFSKNLLFYGEPVRFKHKTLSTTIGGTGLAVSAFSKHKDVAIHFAKMVASAQCQQTMYVQHGGQPGHKAAWLNEEANQLTNQFFKNILPVMENGYIRPRYNGYLHFQDQACIPLQKCLMQQKDALETLKEMNAFYHQSLVNKNLETTSC